jgi:hypothetical protein
MNTYVRDNESYLKQYIHPEAATEKVISGGAITITQSYHEVSGEGDANDELDTVNGGSEGIVLILRAVDDTITLKDGTGNLILGGDIVLAPSAENIILVFDGTNWRLPFSQREMTFSVNAFQYPAPGTDWTPQLEGAKLAQSLTSKKVWLPLNFLKLGDIIESYTLKGDAVEAAALTLDCKIVRVNLADPPTTTDIAGGGITQIVADGNFEASATLTSPETVATDKQYTLEILGTTGAGDSILVMGAEVIIRRLI